ncbi:MAG TPA: hypothetical protein PLP58_01805 [Prosthecobacter sp.]|nr:hypothetical protein [Prosthecobacter sp.]
MIGLLVSSPSAVAAAVVPMSKLPTVVVVLPSVMLCVLLVTERKSVIVKDPCTFTGPLRVVAVPRIVRFPPPVFVSVLMPAPLVLMLPVMTVLPALLMVRVRSLPSLLFHALPVKVRVPPMLLVTVLLLLLDSCVHAPPKVTPYPLRLLKVAVVFAATRKVPRLVRPLMLSPPTPGPVKTVEEAR